MPTCSRGGGNGEGPFPVLESESVTRLESSRCYKTSLSESRIRRPHPPWLARRYEGRGVTVTPAEQDRRTAEEAWKNALDVFCRGHASAAGADAAQHHAIAIILAAITEAKKPLDRLHNYYCTVHQSVMDPDKPREWIVSIYDGICYQGVEPTLSKAAEAAFAKLDAARAQEGKT